MMKGCEIDSSGPRYDLVPGSWEHHNELSGFEKRQGISCPAEGLSASE